jgi:DNA-damage-inducible protein J
MANNTTNISVRMDSELKRQAEELFADLGLNMSTAIAIFLRQVVRSQGIPFAVSRVPNLETLAAMQEAERIAKDKTIQGYKSLDALYEDLNK